MSKELVIGSNPHETRVAILEDDQLVEVFFQRANEYSLAGSIHKGRVTRVLPGMQSAFVDLGLERDTFLYVTDFFEEHEDIDTVVEDKPARDDRRDRGPRPEFRQAPQEIAAAPVFQAAQDELGVPVAEVSTVAPTSETPEARPPVERAEDDRGFRGDRRNRRSRRRRQRGHGFPENKYAQPAAPAPVVVEPAIPRKVEEESASGVIILPGESLAKYRHKATVAEGQTRPENRETQRPDESASASGQDDVPSETVIDAEEEEAIEQEAEELELTEKILTHHDDESIADVEEKIEDVKQDQPVPPPLAPDEIAIVPAIRSPRGRGHRSGRTGTDR